MNKEIQNEGMKEIYEQLAKEEKAFERTYRLLWIANILQFLIIAILAVSK